MGAASEIPLCVDLDGTVVRCDTLAESLLRLVRSRPLDALKAVAALVGGRPRFKERVATAGTLDPAALPYNEEVLSYLEREKAAGRQLVLVTASHIVPARAVARHLGIFDDIIATDGQRNLKGSNKRNELVRRFGEGGFDYAGDSAADLAVWPAARRAIVVRARPWVVRRVGGRDVTVIDPRSRGLPASIVQAMRVHQWVKNLLLFVPALLAHRIFEPAPLTDAAVGFVSFSLGASAVYVLNDILDVEADRAHPRKRLRPFASGELPLAAGLVLIPVLAVASLAAAWVLPPAFLLILLLYFALTTAYSSLLKQIALLDVLVLAGLYTVRIMAGQAASGIVVSEWLLAFSMFVFLSLAAVKRYGELLRVRAASPSSTRVEGRGYFAGDLELVVTMGLSSGYIAVLVLALYITSDSVTTLYEHPRALWLACPLALYWISRIWLLAHRGEVQDDPLNFAVKDRVTWVIALLSAALVVAASRNP